MNLKSRIEEERIELPEDFFYKVQRYKEQLFKWNKIHNLTGAKDEQTIDAFIFDALYPVSFIKKPATLMDIGTGAGFPGMILAFALPQTQVTLVEPLAKRASFLQFIKADLGLRNVTVVKKRVEEMEPKIFEMISSRAVTETKMLLELSKNFFDAKTQFLFYKGERVFDELTLASLSMPHRVIETKKRHYLLLGENI